MSSTLLLKGLPYHTFKQRGHMPQGIKGEFSGMLAEAQVVHRPCRHHELLGRRQQDGLHKYLFGR